MASVAESQLMMDMGMHQAMARQSPHQKHHVFGTQLAFASCLCQSVAWQNAILQSRKALLQCAGFLLE